MKLIKWLKRHLFLKAPLSKTMKMTKNWVYYFAGVTIGQVGFGIVWRKKWKNEE